MNERSGKIRIAVWGINDVIWEVIKRSIDPRKVEFVVFLDSDSNKWGTEYWGVPVVAPTETVLREYAIEYVVIAALSAYETVSKRLMQMGMGQEKIQPFITDRMCCYCMGDMTHIDREVVDYIYFEPRVALKEVDKYQEIYKEYKKIPVFEEEPEAWYNQSTLISHACGGIVNGRRVMWSNSKEAFLYSMNEKFRLIECDMLGMVKGELILAHDYWRFYEAKEENYTMITGRELLLLLKKYPEVYCLIDVKWDSWDEYELYVNEIEKIIHEICVNDNEYNTLKNQIIMEVYDEVTIKIAQTNGFKIIFTQYRNPDGVYFMNTATLCYKYGVKAVALPASENSLWNEQKFVKILTDKNIKIFCFSTDSVEYYKKLRQIGVTGIFTNYLTEKDVAETARI